MEKHKKIFLIVLLSHLLFPCDNNYIDIDGNCYHQDDLNILNILLDNSPEINPILDTNNNGIVETLELCNQDWEDGRLTSLDCYPIIIDGNYNWLNVSGEIPMEINQASMVEIFKIPYNQLIGNVPESICNLNLDFSDIETFNLRSNDLCPPYPECIEDYMGSQSNYGTDSCEIGNCYDLGISQITAVEINGDDLINTYNDFQGNGQLLISMHNDGPDCNTYPGLLITASTIGTNFPTDSDQPSINWWYAIAADNTYFSAIPLEISPFVPENTEITITAKTVIMGCMEDSCSEDPYCHECPLTEPMSIDLTIGDFFPTTLGDSNMDGEMNVLDVVLIISFILDGVSIYTYEEIAMQVYLGDMNQDNNVDVLDIVLLVDKILN